MNNDYITRRNAMNAACSDCYCCVTIDEFEDTTCPVKQKFMSIPAADVAPVKHGYFLGTEYDGYADGDPVYYEWECSECGCVFEDEEPHYKYCPNCGAKMDKEKNHD